jgi:hypothetical protein
MATKRTKTKTGVLRVGRAILNRIQDDSKGLLIEEPAVVREFLGQNSQIASALEKASRLPLKAIWDLESTAVQDVRILTTSYESVQLSEEWVLQALEVTFQYKLLGDRDEAASDLGAGIIPTLKHGKCLFTFSFFEEFECELD